MKKMKMSAISIVLILVVSVPLFARAFKSADGTKTTTWEWTIEKTADQDYLVLSDGQTITVNYDVTVSAIASVDSWVVEGWINIVNASLTDSVTITSIVDSLDVPGVTFTLSCPFGDLPYTFPPNHNYLCDYTASGTGPAPVENTVDVYSGSSLHGSATVAVNYSTESETDGCVDVDDTLYGGTLGSVCADDENTSFTLSYPIEVGPYTDCTETEVCNTAGFVTDTTGTTGTAGLCIPVSVPCTGGCTLTPGYWKTHSEYGPAPYDDTWALLEAGADTTFFSSGQTWYQVFWTAPRGNAYYILAHAYMAAVLNGLNGADTATGIPEALAYAEGFFSTFAPGDTLSREERGRAIDYAGMLDAYNNGIMGPGHCSEEEAK